ncbi:MAG: methyltransferase [Balneolaceae bacterium]
MDTTSNLSIKRYPSTTNKSLQAWNAGDEFILQKLGEMNLTGKNISIYNDRFGYLSCHLNTHNPKIITHRKSQEKSIKMNLEDNQLQANADRWLTPFSQLSNSDICLLQIPKSLDLFKHFLHKISSTLSDDGTVICAFMTKYFTPSLLEIANDYFEEVEQSLAQKKSRLLVLKKKKPLPDINFLNTINYSFDEENPEELKQYPGVFSSGNIDYATQFLMDTININKDEPTVLDLGSGNGVIARYVQKRYPEAELHLMDDSILAIESSKLNLDENNTHFHWEDSLENITTGFDLILSNPPFHFGHETNIEVSLKLFSEVAKALKPNGRFVCVANQHLNYKVHLEKMFTSVDILSQNKKFIIYQIS